MHVRDLPYGAEVEGGAADLKAPAQAHIPARPIAFRQIADRRWTYRCGKDTTINQAGWPWRALDQADWK
jgi:hypothetical protein